MFGEIQLMKTQTGTPSASAKCRLGRLKVATFDN